MRPNVAYPLDSHQRYFLRIKGEKIPEHISGGLVHSLIIFLWLI